MIRAKRGVGSSLRLPMTAALLPAGIVLIIVYVMPLSRLVINSLLAEGHLSLEHYIRLFQSSAFAIIIWRTLRVSVLVTLLCGVLGYPLAYTISRLPARWASPLLLCVTIPFFTSLLVRSYAWVVILGNNGLVNRFLISIGLIDSPLRLVYNEFGAFTGMVQVMLPVMVLPLYAVMRRIDRSQVLAAQSLGASPAVAFMRVFLPLSMPGVAAGASLVFVILLGFFVTPAVLGGPGEYMVAQSMEVRTSHLGDFKAAAAEGTLLLILVAGLMLLWRRQLGISLAAPGAGSLGGRSGDRIPRLLRALQDTREFRWATAALDRMIRAAGEAISIVRRPLLGVFSAATLFYLLLPMIVVVPLGFSDAPYLTFPPPGYSLRWFASYLGDRAWMQATWFSLLIATASASLATILGTLAALPFARSQFRLSSVIYLIYVSPLILPHMAFAVALYLILARADLIGNPLTFIGAYTVFGLPYAIIIMTASLQRFDRSLEYAASSLGAPPVRVMMSITLPLLRPAIASTFLFAFFSAFDDVIAAIFLCAPSAVTLPIRMWEDIRAEISPRIAAIAVLFFGAVLLLIAAFVLGRTTYRLVRKAL